MFATSIVSGTGAFNAACPTGFNLLSCGNENTQTTTIEKYRRIRPIDGKTCECYDRAGMTCVAWCTTLPVPQFEIVSVGHTRTFSAQCPAGKQALGCHVSTTARDVLLILLFGTTIISYNELWRRHFPGTAGSSCTCYDYYGANCVATCGSPSTYEIVSQWSSGTFSVSCTNSTHKVLGCGMDPLGGANPEKFRSVRVFGGNSCQCFDRFGATCYAICGKIWWSILSNSVASIDPNLEFT